MIIGVSSAYFVTYGLGPFLLIELTYYKVVCSLETLVCKVRTEWVSCFCGFGSVQLKYLQRGIFKKLILRIYNTRSSDERIVNLPTS